MTETAMSPAEWVEGFLAASPEIQLQVAKDVIAAAARADYCIRMNHDRRLQEKPEPLADPPIVHADMDVPHDAEKITLGPLRWLPPLPPNPPSAPRLQVLRLPGEGEPFALVLSGYPAPNPRAAEVLADGARECGARTAMVFDQHIKID
jgi:hypothetical protein